MSKWSVGVCVSFVFGSCTLMYWLVLFSFLAPRLSCFMLYHVFLVVAVAANSFSKKPS